MVSSHEEKENSGVSFSFQKDISPAELELHPYELLELLPIPSQALSPQSHQGLELQHMNWESTQPLSICLRINMRWGPWGGCQLGL